METDTRKENKMGVMPVRKLLITMSLPMILSMLVQALYNIVDSIFVARINTEALAAVSLVFPIQNLMIAVANGTCVGINALLSKSLGEKNFEKADKVARNGIFLALASTLAFALIGIFFSRTFFSLQTDDPQIIEYGYQYMMIVSIFSVGIFMQCTFERLLQSTGNTFYNMITQGTGAIINIILDPILIFGLFGFPRLEIAGAAIATVIGQICAMLLAIYFNIKRNKEININMCGFRPDKAAISGIYKVGIPSICMQAIGSVMLVGFNRILLSFSTAATAVLGIYFKLQSFIFMPVFGMTSGMIPIISYNYGAQNKKRILETLRTGIVISVSFMIIGASCFKLFPDSLIRMFSDDPELISVGVMALRTISWCFPFAGFAIVVISCFQALGNGVYSLIISLARQLLILLPAAYILSKLYGLDPIWWSFPIAELMGLLLSSIFFRKIYRDRIQPLP